MKIIVRKMPDMVLDKSFEQIEGMYETCFNGKAMETFLKSIEMSQNEDCLNLEDDIILCMLNQRFDFDDFLYNCLARKVHH